MEPTMIAVFIVGSVILVAASILVGAGLYIHGQIAAAKQEEGCDIGVRNRRIRGK